MARPRPLPTFGDLEPYAFQGPMTRQERRLWYRKMLSECRRAEKARNVARREGTLMKLDVWQRAKDARGSNYTDRDTGEKDDNDKPIMEAVRLRDLIYTAMQDEPSPNPMQGVPPPPVDEDNRKHRWRISVEIFQVKEGDLWEMAPGDAKYIRERATVMCSTPAYGFIDACLAQAEKDEPPPPMPGEKDPAEEEPPPEP